MPNQTPTGVEAEPKNDVWSTAEPRSGSQFSIGLGATDLPRYEGANEDKLRALPVINYRDGRFFAGLLTGVGGGWATAFGPVDRLLLDLSAEWADREIMQAYFGLSGAQSARSGLGAYNAGAGIRRYGLSAAWTHAFTPNWFSIVGATFYRLGAEAADSPTVQQRHVTGMSAALSYRF